MATIGEIAVNLVARTTGFDSGLKQASASISTFAASAGRAAGTLASMVGIAGGFGGMGWAVKLATEAETATVAINTMTGSLAVTRDMIAEINKFAAVTPFEPAELRAGAQALLAYGFSAGEVMPALKTLGDISAGTGRRLIEFINIVGKVRDRGKLTAETLNEFGIRAASIMEPLARVLGVSREEVVKLASAGEISFADLQKALQMLTTEGGLYFDAMAKQAETLAGRWSTLTGNVGQLAENIGAILVPVLGTLVNSGNKVLDWLLTMNARTVRFAFAMTSSALAFAGMMRVIPVVIAGFRAISAWLATLSAQQTFLTALGGPSGLAKIAIAGAAAAAVFVTMNQATADLASSTKDLASSMDSVAKNTKRATDEMVKFTSLRATGRTAAERAAELERRAVAAGFAPTPAAVRITSRPIGSSSDSSRNVVEEVRRSNELLNKIEANTREGGVEVNEVSL